MMNGKHKFDLLALAIVSVLVLSATRPGRAQLQLVDIDPLNDKGVHDIPDPPCKIVASTIVFPVPPGVDIPEAPSVDNHEFYCSSSPQQGVHLFNVYPTALQIPSDARTLELYFFMAAADQSGELVPLPAGSFVGGATLTGASGTEYGATLTSITDLNQLPTSTAMTPIIEWDLGQFASTTGPFQLSRVEMPISELVPEPGTLTMLMLGGIALCLQRRKRWG